MNRLLFKPINISFIVVLLLVVLLNRGQPVTANPPPLMSPPGVEAQPLSSPDRVLAPLSPLGSGATAYHIPGSVLVPTHSNTKIATDYMGCFHLTAGSSYDLNAPLLIPNGSRIVELRLFYYDVYGSIDSWIYRYNDLGTSSNLVAYVGSVGNSGHTSVYTTVDHVVDNFNYKYVLEVRFNGTDEDIQVCGLRVLYYPPKTYYLPAIFRN